MQLPPILPIQRRRTAQTGAGTGAGRRGNGLAPRPLLLLIGKTALAEYAKLTAARETLNRRQLAAGTARAAAPQGAGYGAVTDRAAVLKSVVSKPPFGVRFRLGRVNRTAAHLTVFLYAVSVGGWGIYILPNKLEVIV